MHDRLKLLYVVEAMGGGVFTYIVDLANELANVYDVYIAYALRPQTPEDYENYFDKRIHLIRVKNFTRSLNPVKDIKAFFEIKHIENQIKPDIIHLHSSKAGVIGRLAFNGKKTPLFYTPHGYSFLMSNHSKLKRNFYYLIEFICGKRNCTTISCSQGEHKESLKIAKSATFVDNGVNIKQLQRILNVVEPKGKNKFTIFTLGRICHQKNPDLFNCIAEKMPEVRFLWIGDGELRNRLTAPNIEITGWIEREDALKYSISANAFILTSLWEGLPISLLEAMYMKKICIVSDVIGNRDVINNNINGFVCNSVDEFVKAIKLAQYEDNSEMINRAYMDILEKYNTSVMAMKYKNIYQSQVNINT